MPLELNETKETVIRRYLSKPAVFEQMAEEASELAQAALKYARILRNENPTPKTETDAINDIIEEWTDLHVVGEIMELTIDSLCFDFKMKRWYERLQNMTDYKPGMYIEGNPDTPRDSDVFHILEVDGNRISVENVVTNVVYDMERQIVDQDFHILEAINPDPIPRQWFFEKCMTYDKRGQRVEQDCIIRKDGDDPVHMNFRVHHLFRSNNPMEDESYLQLEKIIDTEMIMVPVAEIHSDWIVVRNREGDRV